MSYAGRETEALRPEDHRSTSHLRVVGLCGLIAVRALMWRAYLDTPIPAGPVSDSWLYLELAQGWNSGNPWPLEAAFHSPLYPYLLGLLLRGPGGSIYAALLVQNLAGIVSGMIILEWLLRASPSRARFWIGLLLLVQSGPWLAFEWRLFPVSFAITAEVVLVEVGWQLTRRRSPLAALAAGLVAALLMLLRPNFALAIPLLWVWGSIRLRRQRGSWRLLASVALLPVLCATPFLLRNHELGAGYTLAAGSGITFYQGNNPGAVGGYAPIAGVASDIAQQNADSIAVIDPAEPDRVRKADGYWWRKGMAYLASNPGDAAKLLARKLWLFLSPAEIGGDIEFAFERQRAPLLSFVAGANFTLLLVFGIAGLTRHCATGFPRGLLSAFVSISFLTCMIFYVAARYRVPAWPLLLFPACAGIEAFGRRVARLRARGRLFEGLGTGVALVGVSILLLWSPLPRTGAYWLIDWHNWGVAWEHAGHPERALSAYAEVLALEPNHRATLENLGGVHARLGDLAEAERTLMHLVEAHPDSFAGFEKLSHVLARLGRTSEAREAEQRAVALRPDRR